MALFSLSDLQSRIENEMREHPYRRALRACHRTMIAELERTYLLPGQVLLDLGVSVHGNALEAALDVSRASRQGEVQLPYCAAVPSLDMRLFINPHLAGRGDAVGFLLA
ncbi:hypothetical protein BH20VER1_BH20VER1_18720 [soil metagenome]